MRTLLIALAALSLVAIVAPADAHISNDQGATTCADDGHVHYHTYGNGGSGCFSFPGYSTIEDLLHP